MVIMNWEEHQKWESDWWGDCIDTFGEECKQISYAYRMGLVNKPRGEKWPSYDLDGGEILDIGGGPVSMLLKSVNGLRMVVADPCDYPEWVQHRYAAAGIEYHKVAGEDLTIGGYADKIGRFHEVWIYNVLQHVQDPELIIQNAKRLAPTLRIFEWINIPVCPGHPHELKAHLLQQWIDAGYGTVEAMRGENNCNGTAFYGVFNFS
jgi:2-polyprenyl-3-methyl-5-hydroxy-6-metoxy-1,4-benzoquinol methylase